MFTRECSKCNRTMSYKRKNAYVWSIRHNCKCKHCSNSRPCSKEQRKRLSQILKGRNITWGNKISCALKGRKLPQERVEQMKIKMRGKGNPFYGHTHTDETKRKIRLSSIKTLQKRFGGGVCPRFNPIACQRIDEYGQQHGYSFQHALNGGEIYIKELGRWLDGYDKERNVVIEYYERCHRRTKEQIKDKERVREIVEQLRCKFIILKEWDATPIIIN